jgi:hypothetical protein
MECRIMKRERILGRDLGFKNFKERGDWDVQRYCDQIRF